jgi:2,4-dienoyl-CoA reductase-like NADH-dependent reductase (Old Yellow Enzyme family)/thioredoxin reductase
MKKYQHVFSPLKIRNIVIKNRIETAPMLASLSTPDGFVTREMIEFYQSFARGGSGIVTIGDTAVDYDYSYGHIGQLNLGSDKVIGGLSTLVEAVQKYGAKISIELDHPGRLASPKVLKGKNPIGPSSIPTKLEEINARLEGRNIVRATEMNQDMIDQVAENFANSAYRCMTAGFEMIMVHGGHGQLLSQFASTYSNKRTDKYGGSLENRARFAIEVLMAIRNKVGNKLVIEYRISADEIVPEGMHLEETIEFIKMIQDKIDLVNVSLGMIADPDITPYMAQPTYFPYAYNVTRAEKIKKAVSIPVTCVGSIIDLEMADKIIAEGKADIIAMARAQVADPEIVNKTYRGEIDEIRPCLRCNTCGEKATVFLPIRCAVNPVIGREIEYKYIRPAEKKKKIIIIGGGPAGMEAAIIASSKGHEVILYEKEKELGGALRIAASPSFKTDMKRYLKWMVKKTSQSPVLLKLSSEATAVSIKNEKPDVVIIAVGAEPIIPDIPGINKSHVVWAGDVNTGKVKTGNNVLVVGAGMTGCETALNIAQQKKKVMIIDMAEEQEIAKDTSLVNKIWLKELLNQHGVKFRTEIKLEKITDKGAVITDKELNQIEIYADTVVLSLGVKPLSETVKALKGFSKEEYIIGDCSNPRNIMAAIHDAFNIAAEI